MLNNGNMTSAAPVVVICTNCGLRFQVAKRHCPQCGANSPFDLPAVPTWQRVVFLGFVAFVLLVAGLVIFTG